MSWTRTSWGWHMYIYIAWWQTLFCHKHISAKGVNMVLNLLIFLFLIFVDIENFRNVNRHIYIYYIIWWTNIYFIMLVFPEKGKVHSLISFIIIQGYCIIFGNMENLRMLISIKNMWQPTICFNIWFWLGFLVQVFDKLLFRDSRCY